MATKGMLIEYQNCFDRAFVKSTVTQRKNLRDNFRFVMRRRDDEDEVRGGPPFVISKGDDGSCCPSGVFSETSCQPRAGNGSDVAHANLTLTSRNI